MKNILLAGLMIFWVLGAANAQDPSIYNEDPEQRRPVGTEEPGHQVFEPTGGPVAEFRVDPPNWWIGMREPSVELMLHGTNIRDLEPVLEEYPGVRISNITRLENPNYLFVELTVGPGAKQGNLSFVLNNAEGKKAQSFRYQLRNRNYPEGRGLPQITPADVMYLIMPDRFANGDPSNDSFEDMEQVGINRSKMYFRHGGDLQGIMNHLDYF
ncbi:MAG: cyclomaltodextrinase N-terminal domain-containing protein, partial [Bacteroidota bacterium]